MEVWWVAQRGRDEKEAERAGSHEGGADRTTGRVEEGEGKAGLAWWKPQRMLGVGRERSL